MDILIEELGGALWVAALKNGRLEGLEVEPPHEEVRWGSIYWGKVTSINAALDAAFIDLDGDNTGILYNSDVRIKTKDGHIEKGGAQAIGKTLHAGQMIAVQAKSAYLPKRDDDFTNSESKTPQLSMDIALPGRYLIYCPLESANRLSMRIRGKPLRKQLLNMLDALEDINGCILRAAAAHTQTDILIREGKILSAAWKEMQSYMKGGAPGLIALGPDAIQRSLSDQAAGQIDRIEIVTMDHFNHVEDWCAIFAPDLVTKIEPVELSNAEEDLALFHERDIIGQIEDLFQSYVLLQGGGNIII
ncbi:MAG: ribonuclease E/G, partial [Bdellovibrionales bacterium]